MAKRQVFYSFDYKHDAMRVQQVRNIGVIEGNQSVSPNKWEQIQQKGDDAVRKWIDDNMRNRSCVIVLVGKDAANRKWVKYEIEKAWELEKGLVGIYIHNLKCPTSGKCSKGKNPFDQHEIDDGIKMSSVVKCYDPIYFDAYGSIKSNIEEWVEEAIEIRRTHV